MCVHHLRCFCHSSTVDGRKQPCLLYRESGFLSLPDCKDASMNQSIAVLPTSEPSIRSIDYRAYTLTELVTYIRRDLRVHRRRDSLSEAASSANRRVSFHTLAGLEEEACQHSYISYAFMLNILSCQHRCASAFLACD